MGLTSGSKAAKSQAEAQQSYVQKALAPANQLQDYQLTDYNSLYRPAYQTQSNIYQNYAPKYAATQSQLYGEGADLYSQIYGPTTQALNTRVMGDLNSDYGMPKELSDQLFQTSRNRIAQSYAPVRQQASERLAANGTLGSGIGEQVFQHLDDQQLSSMADAAFQQAMQEFDIQRTGRQQSIENVMHSLPYASAPATPNMSSPQPETGAIGSQVGNAFAGYTPTPKTGVDWQQIMQYAAQAAQIGMMFA